MTTRRDFLKAVTVLLSQATFRGESSELLLALPGKQPLIKHTFRPPNYETPIHYYSEMITPKEAFFVRYHLADIPKLKEEHWKLRITGDAVQKTREFSLQNFQRDFPEQEIIALCYCAENRKSWYRPQVSGIQWGAGAMGNAVWGGVRLKDVLEKVGLKKTALEVVVNGADTPNPGRTPDFAKSIPVWKALDENTLIAFNMNGEPLPHWNGFPVRLVVPGWAATYWMKHVTTLEVTSTPLQNFWMTSAYRLPTGQFPIIERFTSQETQQTTPITEIAVNSLITTPRVGERFQRGQPIEVRGIAWDGGYGIQTVEVSIDGGQHWWQATLGQHVGKFSWQSWEHVFVVTKETGIFQILAKTTNRLGTTQPFELLQNPGGYQHNVVQAVAIEVV